MGTSFTSPASVADTGAVSSGAPPPSAELETPQGTTTGAEDASVGATAEPEAGASTGQPEAGTDAGEQGRQGAGDGRAIPAKWRDLAKSDPEFRSMFFADRALKKEFPGGLNEVRALKQTLETYGGEAGVQQMQTDLSDFRTLANQFLDGDPAYIEDVFETDAVAAVSHLPAYLAKAREADFPTFRRIVAGEIFGEISHPDINLRGAMKAAYDAIKAEDPNTALAILNRVAGWCDRIQDHAQAEEDPRVKKLQEQIRKGNKEREQGEINKLNDSYKSEAQTAINKSLNRILDQYLKGRKLEEEDRATIVEQIIRRADKAILKDAEHMKNLDAALRANNKATALRLSTQRWDKELGIAIPKVIRLFALGSAKPPAPPQQQQQQQKSPAANEGFVTVNAMPDPKSIDTYRTTQDMITKQHRAILKNGSKVTWALAG